MIVIPPIPITESSGRLISTNIVEPDATQGEVLWVAGTAYTPGAKVIRPNHKKYEAIVASTGVIPESDPEKWLYIGPTNKWAMFEANRNEQSTRTGTIEVVLKPGARIDSIGILGVEAVSITVTQRVNGVIVYGPQVINMNSRNTASWSDYFFGEFNFIPSALIQDLRPYVGSEITIVIDNETRPAKCSGIVMGTKVFLGKVQYNPQSDVLNFSKIEKDDYGVSKLTPRRSVPKTNQTLWTDKELVNKVRKVRTDLNAVPALWSGLDDKGQDGYFESLLIYGIYKQFTIDLAHNEVAMVTLELEEL